MVAPTYLRSLQALELAVRKGSFVGAAERLGITPAAVGQRVKALEDYLGVELLSRGRAGLRAAPGLQTALPHLARAFEALDAAARELELQRGHELHIAAASDFVDLWLAPRLHRFRAEHPNIRFNINGEGDAPMRLGRVDCEISYGAPRDGVATDLLFRDFVAPITSPVNLARTAGIEARARLEGFPLVHLDFCKDDPAGLSWPDWVAANGAARTAPERGMRFRRISAALDAVAADAGVTLCGLALIGDLLEAGQVGLPYPVSTGRWSRHGFRARFRADMEGRRHVQRFREWLLAESAATAAALALSVGGPPD
ncbi:MAG: LysR family transcriptional regulator [Phenylobacterium sp.]|uniref:LysR substrate-binding domain-containing protein n=1 Tax=Phenylobacterium sp. TaxID=1871053 RepID=UPI001203B485|nr:LysR substrate-binding domain-containing protein [Phenylobacterium sp.]TAL29696.1 MAG: LysR family transcriptional regulator [Phenylobacterium sp.]